MGTVGRITPHLLIVVDLLSRDPERVWYGLEIAEAVGLRSQTVYPVLRGLALGGWVLTESEAPELAPGDRPPRRYHRLTGDGVEAARKALASAPVYLSLGGQQPATRP